MSRYQKTIFSSWSFGSNVPNYACSAFLCFVLFCFILCFAPFLTSRKRAPWVCLAQRVLVPGCIIPVVWVLGVEDADQGNKSPLPLSPPNHWLSHPVFLAHGNRFLNFTSLNIFHSCIQSNKQLFLRTSNPLFTSEEILLS